MIATNETVAKKEIRWTPRLIKRLRGKRSKSEFGVLVGATTNTVGRWEDGRSEPDEQHSRLLSELAARERFLKDWKLAGSGTLVDDLDTASQKLSEKFQQTLRRRTRALRE